MRSISTKFSRLFTSDKLGRWLLWVTVAAIAGLMGGCAGTGVKNTSRTFNTVVIDAGHGGHDSGARSRWGGKEKDAALDTALRLQTKVRAAGFRTVMTRSGDSFVPLNSRVRISNRQSNSLFVSVHFNATRSRAIRGAETYYHSAASTEVSQRILRHLSAIPGTTTRGVRRARFRVLRLNRYPAVLVECGYLTNPSEASRCATPAYRDALATAITAALVEQRRGGHN